MLGRRLSGTSDNNCIKLSNSLAFDTEHLLQIPHYNGETKICGRLHCNHVVLQQIKQLNTIVYESEMLQIRLPKVTWKEAVSPTPCGRPT